MFKRVVCLPGTEANPTKKGRCERPYMYIFNGLLTICYKTRTEHTKKPFK